MLPLREWKTLDAQNYLNHKIDISVTSIDKAGEGNMNCTMRVKSEESSLILKQSSPYCEKFPSIAAPIDRIEYERDFYKYTTKNENLKAYFPEIKFYDENNYILAMSDLGESSDLSYLYTSVQKLESQDLEWMGKVISLVHQTPLTLDMKFENKKMRELNHAHIFQIPFEDNNGLNLDDISPGLQTLKKKFVTTDVTKVANTFGEAYLNTSAGSLLHGDFYLGSIITTERGKFLIDPEFCFVGEKEFDIGVMLAHLYLSGHTNRDAEVYLNSYQGEYNRVKAFKYAGLEMMRRILGYAQLPISKDLELIERHLELASAYVSQ